MLYAAELPNNRLQDKHWLMIAREPRKSQREARGTRDVKTARVGPISCFTPWFGLFNEGLRRQSKVLYGLTSLYEAP